ncbi:MBL fold metallo-hydrolase [Candidatus Gracilibacteria bacterium]|nr:MBL fold metallo-hydrolase [Candidatus Gracilibacteria bacterium]
MKIQFYGENCFEINGKDAKIVFDPNDKFPGKNLDFATNSGAFSANCEKLETKKILSIPGEFEISGVLVRGFYSRPENVVFKVVTDGIACAHFGSLEVRPSTEFFEKLGENVDVLLVNLNEKFGVKEAKDLMETFEPRYTIIGGDQSLFPKMVEAGAKVLEENSLTISQTSLSEDKSEIIILSA